MKVLRFTLTPEDIAESFGILCSSLNLNKDKVLSQCMGKNKKTVNYELLTTFCYKYQFPIELDFKAETGSIKFTSLNNDIESADDVLEQQDREAEVAQKEMLEEIKKSKELPAENQAGVDMMDDDDDFDM
jgi:hypothetical protein